jgi:hypothetical protein
LDRADEFRRSSHSTRNKIVCTVVITKSWESLRIKTFEAIKVMNDAEALQRYCCRYASSPSVFGVLNDS